MQTHQQYIAVVLLSCITGCASTSTQMVNDDGQVINCGAWGFGIIGAPAALISTHECIKKYQAAGYHEVGAPQSSAGSPLSAAALSRPSTMASKDGAFKLTLPAGWVQSTPPTQAHQLYAKNATLDAGLLVSSVDLVNIQDWKKYSESLVSKLASSLTESYTSEPAYVLVNGFDSYRAEISGATKTGVKVHYLATVVKADKQLIYFLSWCLKSKFAVNKAALEKLPSGLQIQI